MPMVFQYNPLETYLETTADGELLCTINSTGVLSPKLRYNVGDEGRLLSLRRGAGRRSPAIRPRGRGAARRCAGDRMRLPLLFLFGRKDSTISYMGANIYPQDVEYGLYRGQPAGATSIESFCLSWRSTPTWRAGRSSTCSCARASRSARASGERSPTRAARGVLRHLAAVSRDFAESLAEDPSAGDLRVRVHDHGTGPFAGTDARSRTSTWSRGAAHEDHRLLRGAAARPGRRPCSSAPPGTAAPRSILTLTRTWFRMVRQMKRMPGLPLAHGLLRVPVHARHDRVLQRPRRAADASPAAGTTAT